MEVYDLTSTTTFERATLKWLDQTRGFGFLVQPGQPDIFVHVGVLRRAGLTQIQQGQALMVRWANRDRGRIAVEVRQPT